LLRNHNLTTGQQGNRRFEAFAVSGATAEEKEVVSKVNKSIDEKFRKKRLRKRTTKVVTDASCDEPEQSSGELGDVLPTTSEPGGSVVRPPVVLCDSKLSVAATVNLFGIPQDIYY